MKFDLLIFVMFLEPKTQKTQNFIIFVRNVFSIHSVLLIEERERWGLALDIVDMSEGSFDLVGYGDAIVRCRSSLKV